MNGIEFRTASATVARNKTIAKLRAKIIAIAKLKKLDHHITMSDEELNSKIHAHFYFGAATRLQVFIMVQDVLGWDVAYDLGKRNVHKIYTLFGAWKETVSLQP
jgi:hypothetical protein